MLLLFSIETWSTACLLQNYRTHLVAACTRARRLLAFMDSSVLQSHQNQRAVDTQCAALKLQCAVMSHTKEDLEQVASAAESKAVACIEESQQLHRHAEQTQVHQIFFYNVSTISWNVFESSVRVICTNLMLWCYVRGPEQ